MKDTECLISRIRKSIICKFHVKFVVKVKLNTLSPHRMARCYVESSVNYHREPPKPLSEASGRFTRARGSRGGSGGVKFRHKGFNGGSLRRCGRPFRRPCRRPFRYNPPLSDRYVSPLSGHSFVSDPDATVEAGAFSEADEFRDVTIREGRFPADDPVINFGAFEVFRKDFEVGFIFEAFREAPSVVRDDRFLLRTLEDGEVFTG